MLSAIVRARVHREAVTVCSAYSAMSRMLRHFVIQAGSGGASRANKSACSMFVRISSPSFRRKSLAAAPTETEANTSNPHQMTKRFV